MISFINAPITLKLFYAQKMKARSYVRFTTRFFEYFPVFNFSLGFAVIGLIAAESFDTFSMNWVDGKPFTDFEFNKEVTRKASMTDDIIEQPAASHFYSNMVFLNYVYLALWFYLDHIISSNRGVAYSFYFPFQKSYWLSVFPFSSKEEPDHKKALKRTQKDLGLGLGLTE